MKFRTEVTFPESGEKIEIEDKIFSIGSCFATEISELLKTGQLQTLNNPFGTIFNPFSIEKNLQKTHDAYRYSEEDLIRFNGNFISLDHATGFDTTFAHKTLEKINLNVQNANQFLQTTKWVIITYGTSFVYEFLPKKEIVANCHKIPQKYFNKRLLTSTELQTAISQSIQTLKDICVEGVQILFSVSPVRHLKDGLIENTLSKAKLITALHEVLPQFTDCYYLPIYEMMMDDLRDYRFYKEDLLHPNSQAIQYIFEHFGNAYFSESTMDFIEENFKISKALEHRPMDETNQKYQDFLKKLEARIEAQQTKVSFPIF